MSGSAEVAWISVASADMLNDVFDSYVAANYWPLNGDMSVSSGKAYGSTQYVANLIMHKTQLTVSHFVEAICSMVSGSPSGLLLGANSYTPAASCCGYAVYPSNSNYIKLYTFQDYNSLAEVGYWYINTPWEDSTEHTMKVVKTGNTFALYVDGTHITPDLNDSTFQDGSWCGVIFHRGSGYNPSLDNFRAGSV